MKAFDDSTLKEARAHLDNGGAFEHSGTLDYSVRAIPDEPDVYVIVGRGQGQVSASASPSFEYLVQAMSDRGPMGAWEAEE